MKPNQAPRVLANAPYPGRRGRPADIVLIMCMIMSAPLGLPGCADSDAPAAPDAPGEIIAAESFLADIARAVAGPELAVAGLLLPGTDPHAFQPRPRDVARLSKARLLLVAGNGYEAWLEPLRGSLAGVEIVGAFGPVEASGVDPHLWMDPRNVGPALGTIVEALASVKPEARDRFSANAAAYAGRLIDLDASIRARVASIPLARRKLLTNHDALSRYAAAYGLSIAGTVLEGSGDGAEASPRALARLIATAAKGGACAIFLDAGEKASLARSIGRETGLKVVTDLYVEGLSPPSGPAPSYLAMLEHDTEVIVDALR